MAHPFPAVSFSLPARVETTVVGSEGADFERAQVGAVDRVSLRSGAIDARVRPLAPGERFVVATLDAEVEVRGTVFRVEAHDGHLSAVAVTEGKVEVRHLGRTALVTAGESWKAPTAAEPPPVAVPPSPRTAAAARGSARQDRERAFAEGVRLIERGDYAAGAEKLEAFRAGNPGDARAEDAAFLAIVSLQRAGRVDDAAAAARRYLDRYPSGYRRAEAQAIAGAVRAAQKP